MTSGFIAELSKPIRTGSQLGLVDTDVSQEFEALVLSCLSSTFQWKKRLCSVYVPHLADQDRRDSAPT